jgi:ubiquinone/menaquinone biosynthesis C-methylase UbiE
MTRLSEKEFKAMSNASRQFFQRKVEFPAMKRMGLQCEERDVVELGCGSGYGAVLLQTRHPGSYVGMDIMPEQIELAKKRGLTNAEFRVQDVTDLSNIEMGSKDVVVVLGILHHVPHWRKALKESHRILKRGGEVYVEEPDNRIVRIFERILKWGHQEEALFSPRDLERRLVEAGFRITSRSWLYGLVIYGGEKP